MVLEQLSSMKKTGVYTQLTPRNNNKVSASNARLQQILARSLLNNRNETKRQ